MRRKVPNGKGIDYRKSGGLAPARHEASYNRDATLAAMRPVTRLSDVPAVPELAVILNCGTKWVTTLALASAAEYAGVPVLLVDCASRDGSREHFAALARAHRLDFRWLEWPLRPHGLALDRLFAEVRADSVLLLDSDVELLSGEVATRMREALAADRSAYGAGFLHGPAWMGRDHHMHEGAAWYAERMWIPCTLLRTEDVRRALGAGRSFAARRTFHDFARHPRLSRLTGLRYKLPLLRRHAWLHPARHPAVSLAPPDAARVVGPSFVEYDTGADLHAWQKVAGRHFAVIASELQQQVRHYHGVTRATLSGPLVRLALAMRRDRAVVFTEPHRIAADIRRRLAERYGIATP